MYLVGGLNLYPSFNVILPFISNLVVHVSREKTPLHVCKVQTRRSDKTARSTQIDTCFNEQETKTDKCSYTPEKNLSN